MLVATGDKDNWDPPGIIELNWYDAELPWWKQPTTIIIEMIDNGKRGNIENTD